MSKLLKWKIGTDKGYVIVEAYDPMDLYIKTGVKISTEYQEWLDNNFPDNVKIYDNSENYPVDITEEAKHDLKIFKEQP